MPHYECRRVPEALYKVADFLSHIWLYLVFVVLVRALNGVAFSACELQTSNFRPQTCPVFSLSLLLVFFLPTFGSLHISAAASAKGPQDQSTTRPQDQKTTGAEELKVFPGAVNILSKGTYSFFPGNMLFSTIIPFHCSIPISPPIFI